MADDKDTPMEEVAEVDEDELLGTKGKDGEEDEQMNEDKADAGEWKKPEEGAEEAKEGEENKEEEKEEEEDESQYDDGGEASDIELSLGDDREGVEEVDETSWLWHIEMYPLSPEDSNIENFVKMISAATQCHVVSRATEDGKKKGEGHFYTNDYQAAKTIMRNLCCRKFACIRPFVYIYHRTEKGTYESASLRLDLPETAKMRWDRQKRNKGMASSCIAKVSNVPLSTSKEFLNVVFARAYRVERMSNQNEKEEARKLKEAAEKCKSNTSAEKKEEKDDEDSDENSDEEEEKLIGKFNGRVTINCCSRTSVKGFLLGYRKVGINGTPLTIKPLDEEAYDIDALRKEVRKKRRHEAKYGKVWVEVTEADRVRYKEEPEVQGSSDTYQSRGGWSRGGRGGRGGGGRGGNVMTGRQKMNEKSAKRGGFPRGGGRGGRGGYDGYDSRDYFEPRGPRGYGGGYHDFPPDPYARGYGGGDGWGFRGGPGGFPGGGRPQRGRRY